MKNTKKIKSIWHLIGMIDQDKLLEISNKYNTDYKVKKLHAYVVFLCIITTILTQPSASLRDFVWMFSRPKFQKRVLGKKGDEKITPQAFHYRLKKIPAEYFAECLELVKKTFKHLLKDEFESFSILIFDSTTTSESGELLTKTGYKTTGKGNKKQVKFTIGFDGCIPLHGKCYTKRTYNSENIALGETILGVQIAKNVIIIFDRGLQDRKVYDKIAKKGNFFIGRLQTNCRIDIVKELPINEASKITKHVIGYLYGTGKDNKTENLFRIVELEIVRKKEKKGKKDKIKQGHAARKEKTELHKDKTKDEIYEEIIKEKLVLVTNIPEDVMPAEKIAKQYRKRWGIEIFFRFIKQTLNFSHFISRSENGIKSIMNMLLICAVLLLVYIKLKNIKSYKAAKRNITEELLNTPYRFKKISKPPFR